jgi:hypothetical protein
MAPAANFTAHETGEELTSIFDPSTCVRKGLCPVTQIRNKGDPLESHSLYFEQHGTGPEKVIFIMGCVAIISSYAAMLNGAGYRLNTSSFSWETQVKHFGRLPKYSILVFDNIGVGYSGAPRGPYTYVLIPYFCEFNGSLIFISFCSTTGQAEWLRMLSRFWILLGGLQSVICTLWLYRLGV